MGDVVLTYAHQRPSAIVYSPALGLGVELATAIYFFALIYKLPNLGIACLAALACLSVLLAPFSRITLTSPLAVASVLYAAVSTTTAFMVDFEAGLYRSLQFVLLIGACAAIANYAASLSRAQLSRFALLMAVETALIFAHMIAFHILEGRWTSWKYLEDTKTTISLMIVIVFAYRFRLGPRISVSLWWLILGLLSLLVLASGERKAYLLLALVFFASNLSMRAKAICTVLAVVAIGLFVSSADPDSYVGRQLSSVFSPTVPYSIAELHDIPNIGDLSDLSRKFTNTMAFNLFTEHPLFGVGATGYQDWAVGQFGAMSENGGLSMNVHGEVNRIPAESGIVGIAIATSYCLLLAIGTLRYTQRQGGWLRPGADHFILYNTLFVFTYLSFEALDTSMLTLIVLSGFLVVAFERRDLRGSAVI